MDYLTISVILLLAINVNKSNGTCSTEYGAKPCWFVPALPGNTPECAKPGITYCEYPTHYPGQRIQQLVDRWRYDHSTLLIDESRNELDNFYLTGNNYGLPHQPSTDITTPFHGYTTQQLPHPQESLTSLKQFLTEAPFRGDRYIPPQPQQNVTTFDGYPDRISPNFGDINPANQLVSYKYTNEIPYAHSRYVQPPELGAYKAINTYDRNEKRLNDSDKYFYNHRKRRAIELMQKLKRLALISGLNSKRRRRQTPSSGQTQNLCTARAQYIMPRAALNNRGNWMYVVNMPEVDNRLTQLVKSETCVSQQCSGICSLPNGYTSRCEQKYVQKRLVALQSAGDQLYTDVFWFPSCCVCTITN